MKGTKKEVRPGTWRLRVVDGYDERGRPHQLSRTVTGTKREADSALAAFVSEVERGVAPTSGGLRLDDYLVNRWLPHVAANREPTTHESYSRRVAKINRALGHHPLAKLTVAQLDAAYSEWAKASSLATVRTLAETISAALEQAVRWALLSRNVAKLATVPRVPRRASTMPTLAEIAKLVEIAQTEDPILAVAIQLAARTGMRRGELCGLRWKDLDTDRLVLTVETATKHVPGRTSIAETKTHRARRFAIDQATVDLLTAHRNVMATVGKGGDDDFVFTWSGRSAVNPDLLTGRFIAIRDKAGLSCRFHDLRHAVATHLLSSGADVATTARRLGFTQQTMLAVYSHALEEADRAAAGIMGDLLSSTNTSKLTV
jgi:integrase